MSASISVVTPTYSGDFESCRLLCDSMDRFVTGYHTHYLVVGDEDRELFAGLAGPRRRVVPHSELLPGLTPVGKWRGRVYWWAFGLGLPIYGWHLQQLRKFAITLAQTSERVICMDSDNCFCRPFDLSTMAHGKVPHFVAPAAITLAHTRHVAWLNNAHALLGLPTPDLPGDDFIGQMITWDRASVGKVIARIEAATGRSWWSAIARKRHFSEYLIYGVAVSADPALAAIHERTTQSPCLAYWDGPALDEKGLATFIAELEPHQSAIAIQSHTRTPIELIRRVALA